MKSRRKPKTNKQKEKQIKSKNTFEPELIKLKRAQERKNFAFLSF